MTMMIEFSKEAPEIAEAFVESLPERSLFIKAQPSDYEFASHIATIVEVDDVSDLAHRLAQHRVERDSTARAAGIKRPKQAQLDDLQAAIVAAAKESGTRGASKKQILSKVKASESQWNRMIRRLLDAETLVRFGKKRGARYFTPGAFNERFAGENE
jgi:DNA-binding Lrp family transcriptional regulator